MAKRTKKEVLAESRKILRNLGGRLQNIEGTDFQSPAYIQFLELQNRIFGEDTDRLELSRLREEMATMTEAEAVSLLRDLTYIDRLRSSTVRGAKSYENRIKPVLERYESWDEDRKRKFIEIYNKTFAESGIYLERFKYEVFELAEKAMELEDPDELPIMAQTLLMELTLNEETSNISARQFSSKLRKILDL